MLNLYQGSAPYLWETFDGIFIGELIDQTLKIKELENDYIEKKSKGMSDNAIKTSYTKQDDFSEYEVVKPSANKITTRNFGGTKMTGVNAQQLEVIPSTEEEIARFRQRMVEKGIDLSKSINW